MKKEISYGVIPLQFQQDWQVLLVQHHAGHWAFPKGHANPEERPQQAAERELQEETGLKIQRFLSEDSLIETYFFTIQGQRVFKTVHYFLALVQGNVVIQDLEIKASEWLSLTEAFQRITFQEGKRICLQVSEFLNKNKERTKRT